MTALLGRGVSLYAQAGYPFALDNTFIRNGVQGDIGLQSAALRSLGVGSQIPLIQCWLLALKRTSSRQFCMSPKMDLIAT